MRAQRHPFLVYVLLSAFAATAASAARVEGTVMDGSGEPIKAVKLRLEPVDSDQPALTAKTKKKGMYLFGLVRSGAYRVKVEAEGQRVSALKLLGVDQDGKTLFSTEGPVAPGAPLPEVRVSDLDVVTLDLTLVPATTEGAGEFGTGVALMGTGDLAKLIESGDLGKARKEIDRGLAVDPDDARLLYLRGYLGLQQERFEPALAAVRRAVEVDPTFSGARLLEAILLDKTGRPEDALSKLDEEIATSENPAVRRDSYVHLVTIGRKLGRMDVVERALDKLLELDPQDVAAQSQLLEMKMQAGDFAAVARLLETAPAELKNSPLTHFNMGVYHWNQGDAARAAEAFRKVVELDPGMADAQRQLGFALANLGNVGEAIAAFERYLELAPDAGDAAGVRAYLDALRKQQPGG